MLHLVLAASLVAFGGKCNGKGFKGNRCGGCYSCSSSWGGCGCSYYGGGCYSSWRPTYHHCGCCGGYHHHRHYGGGGYGHRAGHVMYAQPTYTGQMAGVQPAPVPQQSWSQGGTMVGTPAGVYGQSTFTGQSFGVQSPIYPQQGWTQFGTAYGTPTGVYGQPNAFQLQPWQGQQQPLTPYSSNYVPGFQGQVGVQGQQGFQQNPQGGFQNQQGVQGQGTIQGQGGGQQPAGSGSR